MHRHRRYRIYRNLLPPKKNIWAALLKSHKHEIANSHSLYLWRVNRLFVASLTVSSNKGSTRINLPIVCISILWVKINIFAVSAIFSSFELVRKIKIWITDWTFHLHVHNWKAKNFLSYLAASLVCDVLIFFYYGALQQYLQGLGNHFNSNNLEDSITGYILLRNKKYFLNSFSSLSLVNNDAKSKKKKERKMQNQVTFT